MDMVIIAVIWMLILSGIMLFGIVFDKLVNKIFFNKKGKKGK